MADQNILYCRGFPHAEKRDGFEFPEVTSKQFLCSLFKSLGVSFNPKKCDSQIKQSITSLLTIDYSQTLSSALSTSSSSLNSYSSKLSTNSTFSSSKSARNVSDLIEYEHVIHNFLPLLIWHFFTCSSAEDCPMTLAMKICDDDEHELITYKLPLIVYEQSGLLFVCCVRLTTKDALASSLTKCFSGDQLFIDEQNLSFAYSTLNLIASVFFSQNKSFESLELFIAEFMPFGKVTKHCQISRFHPRCNSKYRTADNVIALYITESISTSLRENKLDKLTFGKESIFGTIAVDSLGSGNKKMNKCEFGIEVGNFFQLSWMLPPNGNINAPLLVFDLCHGTMNPFNFLHYHTKSVDEEESAKRGEDSNHNGRLFSYRYSIHRKASQSNNFINSANVFHVALAIIFNSEINPHEIRFNHFSIKFGFNQRQLRKQVQTATNSFSNRVVRDSIKCAQGQLKIHQQNFVWLLPPSLPRNGKLSLDFDLLIEPEILPNIDTQCNFRFDFTLSARFTTKTVDEWKEANQSNLKLLDCELKIPKQMIRPVVRMYKLRLLTEQTNSEQQQQSTPLPPTPATHPKEDYRNRSILIEYKLNSFEYRLLPQIQTQFGDN